MAFVTIVGHVLKTFKRTPRTFKLILRHFVSPPHWQIPEESHLADSPHLSITVLVCGAQDTPIVFFLLGGRMCFGGHH